MIMNKEEEIDEVKIYKPGASRPFSAKKQQETVEKHEEKQYNI